MAVTATPSAPNPFRFHGRSPSDFSWNFEQALVDKNGMLYRRYASAVDPSALAGDIEFLLAKQ